MTGGQIDMTHIEDRIKWPDNTTEETKEWIRYSFRKYEVNKKALHLVYVPSCGCDCRTDLLIDREDMPNKIRELCPLCKQGVMWVKSNPVTYYIPAEEKEYSAEEIKQRVAELG